MNAYKQIAQRIVNAENNFIESVARQGGVSEEDARKVLNLYLAKKIAKIDPVIGKVQVKHGIYLEADIIANAIKMADEA